MCSCKIDHVLDLNFRKYSLVGTVKKRTQVRGFLTLNKELIDYDRLGLKIFEYTQFNIASHYGTRSYQLCIKFCE